MSVFEWWRARRRLREFAPLTTASPDGSHVSVTGVVRVIDETVIAPLSGRECVLFRARVVGQSRREANAIDTHELLVIKRFAVDAAAQTIVIDGGHVLLDVAATKLPANNVDRELAFLARNALRPGRSRFKEQLIAAGDRITIGGVLMRDIAVEPSRDERAFRDTTAPTLVLTASEQHPFVIRALR